jgi:hypothetical protein
MSTFDDREKAYENKFVHYQEIEFKVNARANVSLARWAAEKMHLEGAAVEAYVTGIIDYSMSNSGGQKLLEKIASDIASKGFDFELNEIKNQMEAFLMEAREHFK